MVNIFDEPDSLKVIMEAKTPKETIDIMKENYEEG
jgi:hypothetical protein